MPVGRSVDACPQGLREGFLGSKPLGQIGRRFPVRRKTLEFGLTEYAQREALAKALERGLNALWSKGGLIYAPPVR